MAVRPCSLILNERQTANVEAAGSGVATKPILSEVEGRESS